MAGRRRRRRRRRKTSHNQKRRRRRRKSLFRIIPWMMRGARFLTRWDQHAVAQRRRRRRRGEMGVI
jgi:hypothetical protein